jgi:hypothetical protein
MAKGVTTQRYDLGEDRIRRTIAEMKKTPGGPHVQVGFLDASKQHDEATKTAGKPVTVVEVALANEFGTDRAPERPFMRTSAKELAPKMRELGAKLLAAVIAGRMTVDQALDRLGLTAQTAIKKTIDDWEIPPNAPATIAKKGANNPLVDTGQMRNSVQYVKIK